MSFDLNRESSLYEISFKYRFEAAHRFTKSCAETCATPHGHTWYATAVFQSQITANSAGLGQNDMVVEFSELKRAWKAFIQNTVDHSYMHHFEDPILPALRAAIPKFRGLPFPGDPTTELIAALFFAKLQVMTSELTSPSGIKPACVIIRETPTNTVSFKPDALGKSKLLSQLGEEFNGWWQNPAVDARELTHRSKNV